MIALEGMIMKKILVMAFAVMFVVLVGASAQATFWVPTASGIVDVNYGWATGGGTFAIFDDTDLGLTGSHLTLNTPGDTIFFLPSGSAWGLWRDTDANLLPDVYTGFSLLDSNTFQLAWQSAPGVAWQPSTDYTEFSPGTYNVLWGSDASLGQIDAVPSAVPIPPSAIMLISGFLGLVGVRRMRRDS